MSSRLPVKFSNWFQAKGWSAYPHQLQMIEQIESGKSILLIAPTGAGKTLSGFLPSLIDLAETPHQGLHTLYLSPIKALAVDIARNLDTPISEMGLPITVETRTGDTPQAKRNRQRTTPPNMLMTTPESLELMLSWPDADRMFGSVKMIIIDEIHALAGTKRGDLLSLSLAALRKLAPHSLSIGLSATVANPDRFTPWLDADQSRVAVLKPDLSKAIELSILDTEAERLPWSGHGGLYAAKDIYTLITTHRPCLVFVNTRAQAEMLFQALWVHNDLTLKIGLHHGSLEVGLRRKTEAAMARGELDAVVATSSLDLGIDWADIELVIQVGAPKGTSRLMQRIGRAGHRLDAPSRAPIVPANRFEVLESLAAKINVEEHILDDLPEHDGGLDVLAQHIVGRAVAGPFDADSLFDQVRSAAHYRRLSRESFDRALDFVATGGYALGHYSQFQRIVQGVDGLWRLTSRRVATRWKMNVGTIVETDTIKVRLKGGPVLGEIEDYFVQGLSAGDTFIFAGRVLEFAGMKANQALARPGRTGEPKIPAYAGGRLPLSPGLAQRVRQLLNDPAIHRFLPPMVQEWLSIQKWVSDLPAEDKLLVETFPRGGKHYMVAYCFAGRNAHQTLGMLLTRRMERQGIGPLGFVATDYAIAVWSRHQVTTPDSLFTTDILGDDLEEWMAESSMLKRSFRQVAIISGLIDKNSPGTEKTGKQVTINSDLIYDVLRQHQPDHLLLEATRADAARGMTDIKRLSDLLSDYAGHITHRSLQRVSPLSVPLLLEVGRESVTASAVDELLSELEDELISEAFHNLPQKQLL
ncbi:MAG: DNA ligase-associated DEXH box helicase [SAR116 cluster bacterium]|nr:DNA ligase-associated DEXH box helicase [SAR116 cluster bacterium]